MTFLQISLMRGLLEVEPSHLLLHSILWGRLTLEHSEQHARTHALRRRPEHGQHRESRRTRAPLHTQERVSEQRKRPLTTAAETLHRLPQGPWEPLPLGPLPTLREPVPSPQWPHCHKRQYWHHVRGEETGLSEKGKECMCVCVWGGETEQAKRSFHSGKSANNIKEKENSPQTCKGWVLLGHKTRGLWEPPDSRHLQTQSPRKTLRVFTDSATSLTILRRNDPNNF